MKFRDFHTYLSAAVQSFDVSVETSIRAELIETVWKMEIERRPLGRMSGRFVVFPVKIYTPKIRHLNVLILDQKTKTFERYEPHSHTTTIRHLDDAIEDLLYRLMASGSVYFLRYRTLYGDKNDKNCGFHCIEHVRSTIRSLGEKMKLN